MSIQKSQAIVLRQQDLRETTSIVTFYTKDYGKIKGILRGVRGSRALYAGGALEIFAHDEIVFYDRKKNDIFTVSQYDLINFFNPIRESLEKLSYASYLVELLDSVTQLGDKNEDVFNLMINCLSLLCQNASPKRVARIFEIKMLSLLGLMPNIETCALCHGPIQEGALRFSIRNGGVICKECQAEDNNARPIHLGTVKFISHIRNYPFDKLIRVKVSEDVGRELESTLRRFLDYHIEHRFKTLKFIKEAV